MVGYLTCKRDHIKIRDCMDRRVTSPTWGPPRHLHVNRPLDIIDVKSITAGTKP